MERISRLHNVESVAWLLMQVYNGKERVKPKEIQNVQFREKKSTKKFNVTEEVCDKREALILQESATLKEKLPSLHWNNGEGAIRACSHPDKLPTYPGLLLESNCFQHTKAASNMAQGNQYPSQASR